MKGYLILFVFSFLFKNISAQTINYSYDSLNRLTQVAYPDNSTINYIYDAGGNRLHQVNKLAVATTYTFNGNGNWSDAINWTNNRIPPSILPNKSEIIIDPIVTGECILNVSQQVSSGAQVIVNTGKKFRMLGNLIITQ